MIPQLVTVGYRRPAGRWRRLYIPLLPVVLLLSPLLLLAVIGGLVACVIFRISPTGALRGAGRLLWALPGSRLEMDDGQTAFLIRVR
jgi:hypothetical protein